MSTNAQKGCDRGENKYVKEILFLHTSPNHTNANNVNVCAGNLGVT